MDLRAALAPLLALDPAGWQGLPDARVEDFDALFGAARASGDAMLGWYPAKRSVFATAAPAGDLVVWSRDGRVAMVETSAVPDGSALATLPPPDASLPGEVNVPGASVDEHVHLATGLVLTVARPLGDDAAPARIVRMRGMHPLPDLTAFGPEHYRAFEDHTHWLGGSYG
jgi:hypothetical protein